jgi:hypothetical protein
MAKAGRPANGRWQSRHSLCAFELDSNYRMRKDRHLGVSVTQVHCSFGAFWQDRQM